MNPSEHENSTDHMKSAWELIKAVAYRDAEPADIAAQLRHEGYDALDVVVAALAAEARQRTNHRDAQQPIDVQAFRRPFPPELIAQIVHPVPGRPFVLNGTLYDPEDVRRFDGQELYWVFKDGMLVAFDDRDLMARVWELTLAVPLPGTDLNVPAPGGTIPGPEEPSGIRWPPGDQAIGTFFYEHSPPDPEYIYADWGDSLYLPRGYGYPRLSKVCRGFLCFGDWNDVISAYRSNGQGTVALFEHANYGGLAWTTFNTSLWELNSMGWNDRASGVMTW
jgi:hypothetical protein